SSDSAVAAGSGLPNNYTFTTGDNGTHVFSATLLTAGSQTITATDTATSSINGVSNVINVTAIVTHFGVNAFPTTVVAGSGVAVLVTALDALNHAVPSYNGTIHFTSTDAQGTLPADS